MDGVDKPAITASSHAMRLNRKAHARTMPILLTSHWKNRFGYFAVNIYSRDGGSRYLTH